MLLQASVALSRQVAFLCPSHGPDRAGTLFLPGSSLPQLWRSKQPKPHSLKKVYVYLACSRLSDAKLTKNASPRAHRQVHRGDSKTSVAAGQDGEGRSWQLKRTSLIETDVVSKQSLPVKGGRAKLGAPELCTLPESTAGGDATEEQDKATRTSLRSSVVQLRSRCSTITYNASCQSATALRIQFAEDHAVVIDAFKVSLVRASGATSWWMWAFARSVVSNMDGGMESCANSEAAQQP